MNFWQRFTGHLTTVIRHKHHVFINCRKAGIFWQGVKHDMSKFSPVEFSAGVKYFVGTKSPNEGEREKYGYSLAWMHHKGRNMHHYEYWTDFDKVTKDVVPVKMPVRYVKEMFCDRVAACKVYLKKDYKDSSALEYYNRKKDHREMHPDTAALLTRLLTMLAEEGEEKTFAFIRNLKTY